ncbi:Nitroreductase [Sistotremastrum suecicum HHB10207 ss-3]|uniref:Nitroreductase n=1 Tax=Sistotremastrum suecicum HHB10207 ss-3 TaxID=1314776 RepID=A0A166G471_9AGAM|nr:Nitroreductase [Sistotremastrum suecicum HHB10207 ss-3]
MSTSPSAPFLDAVATRRTIYTISNETTIPDSKIVEIVQHAVKHVPSSFNSQSSRAIVLFGDAHTKVWDITLDILKARLPADMYAYTEGKNKGFRAGYGTVLFFEDQTSVKGMQEKFPAYAAAFPVFSQHTSGMVQFVVWTALEKEGLGASLQHYNPLIDEEIRKAFDVPESWQLVSQMPFGKPTADAGEKTFAPIDERVKVITA